MEPHTRLPTPGWVFAGHGYMHHFNTVEEKNVALRKLIAKEESM
jgi:hypothetical protein